MKQRNVIRLTESQLRSVVKECVEQIIIESTHVLDKKIDRYIDMVLNHIENYPDDEFFTIPFIDKVYPKCDFTDIVIQKIYSNVNYYSGITNKNGQPTIYVNMVYFNTVGPQEYRKKLRHELRHYVDENNGCVMFNGDLIDDEKDPFALIYAIHYTINDSEINARYDELYEYLMANKNLKNIDYKQLPFMFFDNLYEALNCVKNDSISDYPSIVIGMTLFSKNNYNENYKLTIEDYDNYANKINLIAYRSMKKSWINKITKIIEICDKKIRKIIKNYGYNES